MGESDTVSRELIENSEPEQTSAIVYEFDQFGDCATLPVVAGLVVEVGNLDCRNPLLTRLSDVDDDAVVFRVSHVG